MVAPRWGVGWLVPDPAWRSSTECGGAIPMGCDSAKNMMDGARYARPAPTARCSLRRVGARDRIGFALARALLTRCTRAPVGAPTLAATCGCSTRGLASPGGACSLRRRFSHPWALAPLGARSPLHSVASVGAPSLSSRSRGRSLPSAFAAFAPVGVGVGACSLWRRFSHPSVLAPVSARTRRRAPPVGARTRQRSTRE